MKILIVDDVPVNIQVLALVLKAEGFKLAFAHSGDKAIEMVVENKYDLILLDVMMPGIDGFETCRQIKKIDDYEYVPIIFLTALNESHNIVMGFDAGGVDYITKPFNNKEVIVRVKNHLALVEARQKLHDANEELKGANAQLENQLETLNDLYELINKKSIDVQNSINYASNIIKALLPDSVRMQEVLQENFVFFSPANTVGGDYYWIKQIGEDVFFAVADCTGHGVSGAFLSLLGTVYLNELLVGVENIEPDELIVQLGQKMRCSFLNILEDKKKYDMDIGICKLSLTNKKLSFAGVHLPLYLCRDGKVEIIKSNKFSLFHNSEKEIPIELVELQLKTGDILYLTSDGYLDQIDTEQKMKFMRKRFVQLLEDNCHKSMETQKELLSQTFRDWQGNGKQIDDVCVMGIKIQEEYSNFELF